MPVVAGTVVLVLGTAAVADSARRLGRWLYPAEPLPSALAATVAGTSLVVLVLEVLGTAGWLRPWAALVAAGAVWAAVVALLPRQTPDSRPSRSLSRIRGPAGVVALVAAAGLIALLAAALVDSVIELRFQFDALDYHLPIAVQWLQAGNTRGLPYLMPNGHFARYPANFELLELWLLLPVHRDFLVQLASVPAVLLSSLGTAGLARRLGAGPRLAAAAALVVLTLPNVLLTQVGTNLSDLFMAGCITAAAAAVARHTRSRQRRDLAVAGLALGLAAGSRYQALLAGLPVLIIAAGSIAAAARGRARAARRGWRATTADAGLLVGSAGTVGGYFYVRNALTTGNPFYPLAWSLPFHRFPHPRLVGCCSGASWVQLGWNPHVWRVAAWRVLFADRTGPQALVLGRSWGPWLAVFVVGALVVPLVAVARRTRLSPSEWAWAAYPAAELVLYLATPLTVGALAFLAVVNVRFALTAVMAAAALLAGTAARLRPGPMRVVVAGCLVTALASSLSFSAGLARRPLVPWAVAAVVGVGVIALGWRGLRPGRVTRRAGGALGAAFAFAVAVVAASPVLASHFRSTFSDAPYGDVAAHLPGERPVSVVGVCEIYPLYGARLDRRVLYLTGADGIDPPLATTYRSWSEDLARHEVAAVVVGTDASACFPAGPPPQVAWIAQHPRQFALVYRGPAALVYDVHLAAA